MLWELAFRLLITQTIIIILFFLVNNLLSIKTRLFFARHTRVINPPLWALIFIIVFPVAGFVTALIAATTTCGLHSLYAKLIRWRTETESPKEESEVKFRSANQLYEDL